MGSDFSTPQDETVVQDYVLSSLTPGQHQSASVVLARARSKRRRRVLVVGIAAVLLCLHAVSPFVLPVLARMLCTVPGVGPAFKEVLQLHSLDIAYAAGLMPTLDKSVERNGMTLTVHTAYRDGETFELVLGLSGDQDMVKTMSESMGPRVELTALGWKSKGHYSSKVYDEENGVLHITLSSTDPLPWYVRKPNVSVQWMTNPAEISKYTSAVGWDEVDLSDPLQVSFPLRHLAGEQEQVVSVNQTITCKETEVHLESLVFSPVRTILKYTFVGEEPMLYMLDESGERTRDFTDSADPTAGKLTCGPTESETVTIMLAGHRTESEVLVPLRVGYAYPGELGFRIESITATSELLPWISPGREFYADTEVVLSWPQTKLWGVSAEGGHVQWGEDRVTLLLVREGMPVENPIRLTLTHIEGEAQEITVKR